MYHYYPALQALKKNTNFDQFQEDVIPELSVNSSEEAGSLKLDFDKNKQFCDMMLPMHKGESVDGRLGLDILEKCWGRLGKASARGNVLRHLLRRVSSPEDVQRLKGWRARMSEMGRKGREGSISETVVDQQWAWKILDSVDAAVETLQNCRPMMHQTFKKVFK